MAIALAVAAISSFFAVSVATGLEPGVHVDPSSPAAKEYALPLNQARQTGSTSQASPTAPPFGAGIHPRGDSGSGSSAGGTSPQRTALDRARPTSVSGTSVSRSGSRRSGSRTPSSRTSSGSRSESRTRGSGTSGIPAKSIVPAAVLRASSEHGSSGGDGSILALLGGGIAVLVLGGFGGVVMRRSHRANAVSDEKPQ
jgi:hypothetical protein